MEKERYLSTLHQIPLICQLILSLDGLAECVEAMETADTFGPIVDPTRWMKNREALSQDKEFAGILLKCQRSIEAAKAKMKEGRRG